MGRFAEALPRPPTSDDIRGSPLSHAIGALTLASQVMKRAMSSVLRVRKHKGIPEFLVQGQASGTPLWRSCQWDLGRPHPVILPLDQHRNGVSKADVMPRA